MQITIRAVHGCTSRFEMQNVDPEVKIEDIKIAIYEREGKLANRIKLVRMGGDKLLLKDGHTLRDYDIQNGCEIMYIMLKEYELYEGMQVLVVIFGCTTIYPLKVETSDLIFSVKV